MPRRVGRFRFSHQPYALGIQCRASSGKIFRTACGSVRPCIFLPSEKKGIVGCKESPIARAGRFPILDRFRHIRGREQIEIRAVKNAG
jgi:MoaA/NifB/PqqE/SkfB family radical SAM enzyme